jgi:hypothetical protein
MFDAAQFVAKFFVCTQTLGEFSTGGLASRAKTTFDACELHVRSELLRCTLRFASRCHTKRRFRALWISN